MAIYNKGGTDLKECAFDVDAVGLGDAYNVSGTDLFSASFSFTAMSYNVQWFTQVNNDLSLQQALLEDYDPDMIGYQEFQMVDYDTIPQMAVTVLGDDYDYAMCPNGYGNKNALASKYDLINFTTYLHKRQNVNTYSYSVAWIIVNGKKIAIITCHLAESYFESDKVAQAQEIYEFVQQFPRFILTGDMNTVCKSTSDTEYTTIMKQFVDAGYHCANCTEQNGFHDTWTSSQTIEGTWLPCDHIITSQNITINEVVIDEKKIPLAPLKDRGIDHLPVIAYLTVK